MKRTPPKLIVRKDLSGCKTLDELAEKVTAALSDLQRQQGAQGRILPHKENGKQPRGVKALDRLIGRGARGVVTGVPDDMGKVTTSETPDSVTQYQDPQNGTVAPAVANFPNDGDFGWYHDTVGSITYFTVNRSGALYSLSDSLTTLSGSISDLSGSITAAQHGNFTAIAANDSLHALATTARPGFMSAADKVDLNAATNAATANTLVMRDANADASFRRVTANKYLVGADIVVATPGTGWSMAGGLALDKTLVAFTPNATYLASDLTQIMKYVDALFDLVLNVHGLAKA